MLQQDGSLSIENMAFKSLDKTPGMQYNRYVDVYSGYEPRSSSGLGRRPFKAEITGSTPVRGIVDFVRSLALLHI